MKLSRRQLLTGVGLGVLAVGAGWLFSARDRLSQPPATGNEGAEPVEAGAPDEYALGSLTFVQDARAYLGRDARGFYAIDANCTHMGCMSRLEGAQFVCYCHGSRFTREGDPANGPATRALARLAVGRAANGHLLIDRNRIVGTNDRLPG